MSKMQFIYLDSRRRACFEGAHSPGIRIFDVLHRQAHAESCFRPGKPLSFLATSARLHNRCANCIIAARIFTTQRNG